MKTFILLLSAALCAAADSGIDRLLAGNKRFAEEKPVNCTTENFHKLAEGQEPFAVIVTCSDSRVDPNIIFDEGLGDLFVIRVAGNVIDAVGLESIHYAIEHLHASTLVVMGHEKCGAVDAVFSGHGSEIPDIAILVKPSIQKTLKGSIEQNAITMRNYLLGTSAVKKMVSAGKLKAYAAYYDLQSGKVELLR